MCQGSVLGKLATVGKRRREAIEAAAQHALQPKPLRHQTEDPALSEAWRFPSSSQEIQNIWARQPDHQPGPGIKRSRVEPPFWFAPIPGPGSELPRLPTPEGSCVGPSAPQSENQLSHTHNQPSADTLFRDNGLTGLGCLEAPKNTAGQHFHIDPTPVRNEVSPGSSSWRNGNHDSDPLQTTVSRAGLSAGRSGSTNWEAFRAASTRSRVMRNGLPECQAMSSVWMARGGGFSAAADCTGVLSVRSQGELQAADSAGSLAIWLQGGGPSELGPRLRVETGHPEGSIRPPLFETSRTAFEMSQKRPEGSIRPQHWMVERDVHSHQAGKCSADEVGRCLEGLGANLAECRQITLAEVGLEESGSQQVEGQRLGDSEGLEQGGRPLVVEEEVLSTQEELQGELQEKLQEELQGESEKLEEELEEEELEEEENKLIAVLCIQDLLGGGSSECALDGSTLTEVDNRLIAALCMHDLVCRSSAVSRPGPSELGPGPSESGPGPSESIPGPSGFSEDSKLIAALCIQDVLGFSPVTSSMGPVAEDDVDCASASDSCDGELAESTGGCSGNWDGEGWNEPRDSALCGGDDDDDGWNRLIATLCLRELELSIQAVRELHAHGSAADGSL